MIRFGTTVAIVIAATLTMTRAAHCTNLSWKDYCRLAHLLSDEEHFAESAEMYQKALKLLADGSSEKADVIDVKLNYIWSMGAAGQTEKAITLWKSLAPDIGEFSGTFRELRYYRRAREVYELSNHMVETAMLDRKLMQLTGALIGRDSDSFLTAAERLTETATKAFLWELSLEGAAELDHLVTKGGLFNRKTRIRKWLDKYFDFSGDLFDKHVESGKLNEARSFLLRFQTYSSKPATIVHRWHVLLDGCRPISVKDSMVQKIAQGMIETVPYLNEEVAPVEHLSGLLLTIALTDVYQVKVEALTESVLDAAVKQLERVLDQTAVRKNLLHLQCKSLYALALARRGKLDDAERTLGELAPSLDVFKEAKNLNGIIQAREALAQEYLKHKNVKAVSMQFDEIDKLYRSLPPTTEHKLQAEGWRKLKKRTLGTQASFKYHSQIL
jgi:tetratricopeptide (TPR) repeat protein